MRAALLLAAVLWCPPAQADLFTAQLAYHKGDYEHAFKDYRDLAELGQPLAQYNVAVMYAKGQGVRQSDINAYAWATLAAAGGDPRGQALADELRPDLAPGSEQIAADIAAPFSRKNLDAKLLPRITGGEDSQACKLHERPSISYPWDAANKGIQGNVFMQFVVMADGTTRTPRVLLSFPVGVFDGTVRHAVLGMHYAARPPEAPPAHCEVMFRFTTGNAAGDYPKLQMFVSDTHKKAEQGDVESEFMYGLLLSGVPQLGHKSQDALPWFLKAAQSGYRQAQYEIGSSLLVGRGCQCEENKALLWLSRAAEADQPNAQVTLAQLALRGAPDAADMKRAKLWLERAVARGDHDGMVYLSALLAAAPVPEFRDPARALSLLDKVSKDLGGDPIEFEIRAAAQAAAGNFDPAADSERRAISMASRLHWDPGPLNERLARYQAHTPWYGNLLIL